MRRIPMLLVTLLLALYAVGQEPPKLNDKEKGEFFRAEAAELRAASCDRAGGANCQLQRANDELNAAYLAVYADHKLKTEDFVLCEGPGNPPTVCAGAPEKDLTFRAVPKPKVEVAKKAEPPEVKK
jgi:hypothetical protein